MGPVRVVVTRIEHDGTMQRRMVDTAYRTDGARWEGLATRALLSPPPYQPVPGIPIYHVSLDASVTALVAEPDLSGPLLDLVTAVLALGAELLALGQRPRHRPDVLTELVLRVLGLSLPRPARRLAQVTCATWKPPDAQGLFARPDHADAG